MAYLMQDGVMVLVVGILVEVQLDDVFELQGLPRHRMLLELLDIWYNVCDVVYSAVSCASLHTERQNVITVIDVTMIIY